MQYTDIHFDIHANLTRSLQVIQMSSVYPQSCVSEAGYMAVYPGSPFHINLIVHEGSTIGQ